MSNEPIRVMLVDDHVFWRHGLRQIIDHEPDMKVVAEASNGEEAVRRAVATRPDVILMDVMMPKVGGLEATKQIAAQHPDTRIVMLTVSDTDENLFESIKNGALGFLTKDISPDGLVKGIRDTMEGEASLSPFIAARMIKFIQQGGPQQSRKPPANLTEREDEILRLIARGARDREIADQLFISESTVKKHVQNVLRKLHARNRVEAVSHLDPESRRGL
ncbi:MAG: response regulator transcription factor [Chloroflexi bacterium]|nr:response regulator transcription factor [Chloroflexota bacterium]